MEFYRPRKITFKAWNKESRLLMRLDSIGCLKGELFKKDHILLQFTGLHDKQLEELYEMDIVLIDSAKYVIRWWEEKCGWSYSPLDDKVAQQTLSREATAKMIRLCNYFESTSV